MSLINDMLRDLDRRRQGAQIDGKNGLVSVGTGPVSKRSNISFFTFVMSIAISLALMVAFLYFWQSMQRGVAPETPTAPPAAVLAPAPSAGVDPQEFARVRQRMQELEAQNRRQSADLAAMTAQLAVTEATPEPEPTSAPVRAPIMVPAAAPDVVSPAAAENALVEQERAQSEALVAAVAALAQVDALARESAAAQSVAEPAAPAEAAVPESTGLIRSPRELSFTERDLRQVQDAMQLLARSQRDQALNGLQSFLNDNPGAYQTREALVKLALQGGDLASAERLLDAGLSLNPNRAQFRKLQARIYLTNGNADRALSLLSTGMPSIANDLEYHDLLATAYLSARDFDNAAKTYEQLVQTNRGEARWWYGLASAWDSLGRYRDAALAYEQAIKLPNLSASLRQRSQVRVAEIGQ